jgi:hypothetical protein
MSLLVPQRPFSAVPVPNRTVHGPKTHYLRELGCYHRHQGLVPNHLS